MTARKAPTWESPQRASRALAYSIFPVDLVPDDAARLAPAPEPDAKAVAALVARLGAPDFADRESATKELAALGEAAGRVLAALAAGGPARVTADAAAAVGRLSSRPK